MDQRKEQLKYLKKEYKRKKRHVVTPWKVLTVFGILCTVLLAAAGAYPLYADYLAAYIPQLAAVSLSERTLLIVRCAALVTFAVGISAAIMWGSGKRKLKRSEAYLNWRTMREALRAEKAMK